MTSRKTRETARYPLNWGDGRLEKSQPHRTDCKVQDFPTPWIVAPSTAGTQTFDGLAVVVAALAFFFPLASKVTNYERRQACFMFTSVLPITLCSSLALATCTQTYDAVKPEHVIRSGHPRSSLHPIYLTPALMCGVLGTKVFPPLPSLEV